MMLSCMGQMSLSKYDSVWVQMGNRVCILASECVSLSSVLLCFYSYPYYSEFLF